MRVDLSEATLRESNLSFSTILNTLFIDVDGTGIVLNGASLSTVNLTNGSFPGIQGDELELSGTIFRNTDLSQGTLRRVNWVGSLLNQVNFLKKNFLI